MGQNTDKVFKEYNDVFVKRKEDILEYLKKYYGKVLDENEIIKIERIDATDLIKTSGFHTNLSSWRNTYRNILVSSGVEIDGKKKRYDYKFYITEEKLDPELVEKVEQAIKEVNSLKIGFQFDEALKKVVELIQLIEEHHDEFYMRKLLKLKNDIQKKKEEIQVQTEELNILQEKSKDAQEKGDWESVLSLSQKVVELSKKIRKRPIETKYKKIAKDAEKEIEKKKESERTKEILEKISQIELNLQAQTNEAKYDESLQSAEKIIQLAESINNNEIIEKYTQKREELDKIINRREEIKEEIEKLEEEIETQNEADQLQESMGKCEKLTSLAEELDDDELASKYRSKANEIKIQLEEKEEIERKLETIEKEVQRDKENAHYEGALQKNKELISLAESNNLTKLKEKYEAEAKEISKRLEESKKAKENIENLEAEIEEKRAKKDYNGALESCSRLIILAEKSEDEELAEKYRNKADNIKKEREKRELEDKISRIEQKIQKEKEKGQLEEALQQCQELITMAEANNLSEVQKKYNEEAQSLTQKLEEKKKLKEKIENLKQKIEQKRSRNEFQEALDSCNLILAGAKEEGLEEIVTNYTKIADELKEKIAHQNKITEMIEQLEIELENSEKNSEYDIAIEKCEMIIDYAEELKNKTIIQEYNERLTVLKQKQEEKFTREQKEAEVTEEAQAIIQAREERKDTKLKEEQELKAKAEEVTKLMEVEKDTLPLIDEYKISDILGDITDDMDETMNYINSLLEEKRVEVKKEVKSTAFMRSASGEVSEVENTFEVKEETSDSEDTHFSIESGLANPFDDVIEEAIVSDLIPYNFEIDNVEVNGEQVKELPNKILTAEGLEIDWEFHNIQPKENIAINYDLRRRISRTVIFMLDENLKIIKAHYRINQIEDIDGFYEALIPFTNSFEKQLEGLVIEDIIPLYYVNFVREPENLLPEKLSNPNQGELIKWNFPRMQPGTQKYFYKLLELYKFEELKMLVSQYDQKGFNALEQKNIDEAIDNYAKILVRFNQYLE